MEAWIGLIGVVIGALTAASVQWRLEGRRAKAEEERRMEQRREARRAERLVTYTSLLRASNVYVIEVIRQKSLRSKDQAMAVHQAHVAFANEVVAGEMLASSTGVPKLQERAEALGRFAEQTAGIEEEALKDLYAAHANLRALLREELGSNAD